MHMHICFKFKFLCGRSPGHCNSPRPNRGSSMLRKWNCTTAVQLNLRCFTYLFGMDAKWPLTSICRRGFLRRMIPSQQISAILKYIKSASPTLHQDSFLPGSSIASLADARWHLQFTKAYPLPVSMLRRIRETPCQAYHWYLPTWMLASKGSLMKNIEGFYCAIRAFLS